MGTKTYRAVQVSKPGKPELVDRELTAPTPGKVRIRVDAYGICHPSGKQPKLTSG